MWPLMFLYKTHFITKTEHHSVKNISPMIMQYIIELIEFFY